MLLDARDLELRQAGVLGDLGDILARSPDSLVFRFCGPLCLEFGESRALDNAGARLEDRSATEAIGPMEIVDGSIGRPGAERYAAACELGQGLQNTFVCRLNDSTSRSRAQRVCRSGSLTQNKGFSSSGQLVDGSR